MAEGGRNNSNTNARASKVLIGDIKESRGEMAGEWFDLTTRG
jgi:hypothetical protein